jgi:hypothetical protein
MEILRKIKKVNIAKLILFVIVFTIFPFAFNVANAANPCSGLTADLLCTMAELPMAFGAMLMGLGGVFFNFVLDYSVVNLAHNIDSITGINVSWRVIRDVMNMSFIFILVYVAIGTILGLEKVNWKKTLGAVVIAAVLINFSLFFTKVIIDSSNVLALTLHNQVVQCTGPLPTTTANTTNAPGISNCFMNSLGLTSFYDIDGNNKVLGELAGSSVSKYFLISIMAFIFFSITAFVFIAAAVMFAVRYVIFIYLLILSPIAVLGQVVPGLGDQAKKWWGNLLDQAIFAPIFMLMVWVVLEVTKSLTNALPAGGKVFADIVSPGEKPVVLIMNFFIIIALMIGTLIISKGFSAKAGGWGSSLAGKLVGGTTAWAGRRTVGWGANKFVNSKGVNEWASKKGILSGGWAARAALRGGQKTAAGTYDFRATGAGTYLGAGKAGVGGFADRKEKGEKERVDASARARKAQDQIEIENGLRGSKLKASGAPLNPRQLALANADIEKMELAVARMSGKEIETIVAGNKGLLTSMELANALSTQQLDALNKSDKFSEREKDAIKRTRFADANAITGAGGALPSLRSIQQIQGLTDTELEMISPETLADVDFIKNLKQSQVDSIMKSSKFTKSQQNKIREEKTSSFITSASIDPTIIKSKSTSAKQIAGLPITPTTPGTLSLSTPAFIDQLTPAIIRRIAPELDPEKSAALKAAIFSMAGAGNPTIRTWLSPGHGGEDAL